MSCRFGSGFFVLHSLTAEYEATKKGRNEVNSSGNTNFQATAKKELKQQAIANMIYDDLFGRSGNVL